MLNMDQHAHMHIIPMVPLENRESDKKYLKLQNGSKTERDQHIIEKEAAQLKQLFTSLINNNIGSQ